MCPTSVKTQKVAGCGSKGIPQLPDHWTQSGSAQSVPRLRAGFRSLGLVSHSPHPCDHQPSLLGSSNPARGGIHPQWPRGLGTPTSWLVQLQADPRQTSGHLCRVRRVCLEHLAPLHSQCRPTGSSTCSPLGAWLDGQARRGPERPPGLASDVLREPRGQCYGAVGLPETHRTTCAPAHPPHPPGPPGSQPCGNGAQELFWALPSWTLNFVSDVPEPHLV